MDATPALKIDVKVNVEVTVEPQPLVVPPSFVLTEEAWMADREVREVWINIDSLFIPRSTTGDDGFQRAARQKTVRKVAHFFKFGLWDLPWVVWNEDEGYWEVVDGGNRIDGLRLMGYTGRVPCVMQTMEEVDYRPAKSFLEKQGSRINLNLVEVYVASVNAGEPWALEVRDVLKELGLQFDSTNRGAAGRICCVASVKKIWENPAAGFSGARWLKYVLTWALKLRWGQPLKENEVDFITLQWIYGLHLFLVEKMTKENSTWGGGQGVKFLRAVPLRSLADMELFYALAKQQLIEKGKIKAEDNRSKDLVARDAFRLALLNEGRSMKNLII